MFSLQLLITRAVLISAVFPAYTDKLILIYCLGGHSGGETPGNIPNPEVKPITFSVVLKCASLREAEFAAKAIYLFLYFYLFFIVLSYSNILQAYQICFLFFLLFVFLSVILKN